MLRQLRGRLLPSAQDLLQRARAATDRGDWAAAVGFLHQLKGSAAAVGAEVLAQACARGEQDLKAQGGPAPALQASLAALDDAMQRTLPALRQGGLQAPEAGPPAEPLDAVELWAGLRALKPLLDQADMEAIEVHERWLAGHPQAQGAVFARLNALMEQLDLAAAAREVEALLQQWPDGAP